MTWAFEPRLGFLQLVNNEGGDKVLHVKVMAITFLLLLETAAAGATLVGHWKFDEGIGILATDSSGNGLNGTLNGSITWVPGISGTAVQFAGGTSTFVRVEHDPTFDFSTEFSIAFWINGPAFQPANAPTARFEVIDKSGRSMGSAGPPFHSGWKLVGQSGASAEFPEPGTFRMFLGTGVSTQAFPPGTVQNSALDNTWRHVTFTVTTVPTLTISYYYDGILQGVGTFPETTLAHNSDPLFFGNSFFIRDRWFIGALDEIRLYDGVLSGTEIADLANPPASLDCSGFQSPFDNGLVTVRKNRALPLKAELFDADGFAITDPDIAALPVLQVTLTTTGTTEVIDVSEDALPAGQGTDGNQFVFSEGLWRFNLKTKNYSAAGTYTITMVSGDDSEYSVRGCQTQFVVNP